MSRTTQSGHGHFDVDAITHPLSPTQERFWLLDQLDPEHGGLRIGAALRLRGPLDAVSLSRALQTIVDRHEVLRTTFDVVDGQVRQIVNAALELPLVTHDLSGLDPAEREAELVQRIRTSRRVSFDLGRGPLVTAQLLRLAEEEHVLLLVAHHIVMEGGSSVDRLCRELFALYAAYHEGRDNPLPPLEVQYGHYARWSRERAHGPDLQGELAYWLDRFRDGPVRLDLRTDRPRKQDAQRRGGLVEATVDGPLLEALHDLRSAERVSVLDVLLSALTLTLHRYTGQTDIGIGMVTGGHTPPEFQSLLGVFINTVVLRTDLEGNPTFRELLGRVRRVARDAYSHSEIPFETVIEGLDPARRPPPGTFPQVLCSVVDVSRIDSGLPFLKAERVASPPLDPHYDLIFYGYKSATSLALIFVYDAGLFDASTVERLKCHYLRALAQAVKDPDVRLSDIVLIDDEERETLLARWNDVSASYPVDGCLHELFERQVARTPDAVALTFNDRSLSYRELDIRANRLAHALRARGVGPDVLVGLCVERSIETVVGILGILKAGGAYVPLDLANPADRIAFILEDTAIGVLVTQSGQLEKLPKHAADVICLDRDSDAIDRESDERPESGVASNNLAYVIYTSGSTGKPKGVLIEHASVVRLFSATEDWFHFDSTDVWTLFHSCAFDFSVWEIWGALLYGGRLVVVPYWISRSPEEFYELLARERVTVLNQTPSAFRQLMVADEALDARHDLALRFVIFGGEALELHSLAPWFDRHGDTKPRLVNMYGITETTVHVTYRPLTAADARNASGSLIGVPIPDLQVYVLDAQMQPVPIGLPGEMYVGGAGVARGYLDRPELTAERFVRNPFRNEPEARLYRTGDVARYRPDRDLEYLGRNDEQVKIRGFRIELGEIEAALIQRPEVRDAVVTCLEDGKGDRYLVAYVVGSSAQAPSQADLRSALSESMPDYMVPSAFVFLDSLPLTTNGKVDRRALPSPAADRASEEGYIAPRNEIEERLAAIWRGVLGVETIGVHDDFFHLGGHSLIATQVLIRMTQEFGVRMPLSRFFRMPTVARMAEWVNQSSGSCGSAAAASTDRRARVEGEI